MNDIVERLELFTAPGHASCVHSTNGHLMESFPLPSFVLARLNYEKAVLSIIKAMGALEYLLRSFYLQCSLCLTYTRLRFNQPIAGDVSHQYSCVCCLNHYTVNQRPNTSDWCDSGSSHRLHRTR